MTADAFVAVQQRPTVLHATNLTKAFRTSSIETHAVRQVNLSIAEGEFVSIVGPSGSGKSTLLSVLGLMEQPTSGTLLIGGKDVSNLGAADRSRLRATRLGFVFQFFHLIGDLTIAENVGLPMHYAGASASDVARRVGELLERLGIGHRAKHFPAQLSGGQQQRAAIARALVNDPRLILVDEPTGNLDSESGAQVVGLLRELHSAGTALCLVTHDPELAAIADRQFAMCDGCLAPK